MRACADCVYVREEIAPGLPYGPTITIVDVLAAMATGDSTLTEDDALPVASFEVTERIGLTAVLDASPSAAIFGGNGPLVYAWSGPGLTFDAPAGTITGVTAAGPGTYGITLTVTDANGDVATMAQRISLDRILRVGGNVEDNFASLQGAFNWINAVDAANAASYLIEVTGLTTDTARIAPNQARVLFRPGGAITVGVDFTAAGSYRWYGAGSPFTNGNIAEISTGVGNAITLGDVSLELDGLRVTSTDAAGYGIYGHRAALGGALRLSQTRISGVNVAMDVSRFNTVNVLGSVFYGPVFISEATARSFISSSVFDYVNPGAAGVTIIEFDGTIANNVFNAASMPGQNLACLEIHSPTTNNDQTAVANNTMRCLNGTGGTCAGVRIVSGGTGALDVSSNAIQAVNGGQGIGIHLVGTFPTGLRGGGNVVRGGLHALLSTTDAAGAIPLAQINVPLYGNTLIGPVTNVTFAAGTALNGGNIQA